MIRPDSTKPAGHVRITRILHDVDVRVESPDPLVRIALFMFLRRVTGMPDLGPNAMEADTLRLEGIDEAQLRTLRELAEVGWTVTQVRVRSRRRLVYAAELVERVELDQEDER